MTIDKEKLKALAEGCRDEIIRSHGWVGMFKDADLLHRDETFLMECSPEAVLELIAEIESLGAYLCYCPECGGEGEIFTGSYSYFGHMDPPEPNMTKCVECDGKGLIGTPQELHAVIAERDQLKAENEKMRGFLAEVSRTSGDKWAVMAARNLLKEFGHD